MSSSDDSDMISSDALMALKKDNIHYTPVRVHVKLASGELKTYTYGRICKGNRRIRLTKEIIDSRKIINKSLKSAIQKCGTNIDKLNELNILISKFT